MRKHAGIPIGGYVAGGLVGLYVLGFIILWIDHELELLWAVGMPEPIGRLLAVLYGDLFRLLGM